MFKQKNKALKSLLLIFLKNTTLITPTLGVFEQDGFVYYLLSEMPVFTHHKEDLQHFRHITSNFIHQGLCNQKDIVKAFKVSTDSVRRNLKKLYLTYQQPAELRELLQMLQYRTV